MLTPTRESPRAAATDPRPPGPATGRFLAGDPLRGLAALGVAVYHAGTVSLFVSGHSADLANGWPTPFGKIAGGPIGAGAYGVDIFFVLSGYLISRPFVAAYSGGRPLPRIGAYLRNRVLRIVPAYWVALAAVVLVAGAHGRTWSDAPRLLGFSEDWATSPLRFDLGQAWTLGVEVRYYLAVPILAIIVFAATRVIGGRPRTPAARLWLVGILAAAASVYLFQAFPRDTQQEDFRPIAQAYLLLAGVVLGTLELGGTWRWLASRAGRALGFAGFAAGVVTLIWMQYPGSPFGLLPGLNFERSISSVSSVAALLIVGIPLLLQRAGAGCWRWLDNRPLRWLGTRSYGFYLYQLGVLTELSYHAPDEGLYRRTFVFLIVVGIPVILALAALSWRLVERPALRLKASTR
ncbi:MAG TPA: acyltransferase [Solirubrobacteraceae bacterium]|nr:acyltransferase [Solirubrobacteraceae bacterium]